MYTVLHVHYISIKWGEKNSGVWLQSKGEFFFFLVTAQSFIRQTKDSTPLRHEGGLTPEERPQSILAFSFYKLCLLSPEPQFSCSVGSNSLWPHGLQHTRLSCPSPTPRVYSNSCLLSQWYHPTISSSIVPFSSCPQSFAASESFPMSQLFTSGGQSIEASVFPMNIQGWIRLGLTGLISMMSRGLSRVFSNTTVRKYPFFGAQPYLLSSSHSYTWLLEKLALTIRTFVGKVMSLLFNMMSRFVIAFLPSSELHGYNHHPQ